MQTIQDGMQLLGCLDKHLVIYSATGMSTGQHITLFVCTYDWQYLYTRSWKNHLRSCKPDNQVTIYQTLCILIDEHSLDKFNSLMDQFVKHWEIKEPGFIEYFKKQYQTRPGEQKENILFFV